MAGIRTDPQCPKCGSVDAPKLIVRDVGPSGSMADVQSVKLRCRSCHEEWSGGLIEQYAS